MAPSRWHSPQSSSVPTQTVLIVDDTPQNLTILGELLRPHYRIRAANSGERALRVVGSDPAPDIILLDVTMPGMSGHEVRRRLRADQSTRPIPVIFNTAISATEDEQLGLELGAVDHITKPFKPAVVLARVRTQLELKQARDRLANENDWLEHEVARRMHENVLIQDLNVRALACIAEARDNKTGHHIVRTQFYVDLLARHLVGYARFQDALAGNRLAKVVKAAPLHDIGKVGIPDAILLKPGKLTAEEFEVMKTHAQIGASATLGALSLQKRAAAIEATLKAGLVTSDRAALEDDIDKLEREYLHLVSAINTNISPKSAQETGATLAPVIGVQVADVLGQLGGLLTTADFDAVDLFRRHQVVLRAVFGEQAQRLDQLINDFIFDEALDVLRSASPLIPVSGAAVAAVKIVP